jgi:hypothetical protein
MKTVTGFLVIFFLISGSLFSKLTVPMQFLHGPEDAYVYSFDYNPVCGVAAAVVVSEYDYSKNWVPTKTALLIKKDGDSVWSVGMTDVRSDAIVRVFNNGVIKVRSKFQVWSDSKYVENQWLSYTVNNGLKWDGSPSNWPSQDFFSSGTTLYNLWCDYLYLSFDLGTKWYKNTLPNTKRDYQHLIYFNFITVSDSGMAYVQSKPDYFNYLHPDSIYFLKSKDQILWGDVGMNLREQLIDIVFRTENQFFAITDSTGVLYTSDQGKTFSRIALTDKKFLYMKFTDNSRSQLYVANHNEAYLINADDFSVTKLDVPGGKIVGIGTNNKRLYACILSGGVCTSDDLGKTWNFIDKPTRPLDYYNLKIDKNNILYVLSRGFYPVNSFRLYRSADYGTHWEFLFESDKYLWLEKLHGKVYLNHTKERKIYYFDDGMKLSFDYKDYDSYNMIMPYGDNSILLDFIGLDGHHYYYKSNDDGNNWSKTDTPETSLWVNSYFVKDNGDRYRTDGINYLFLDKNLNVKNKYNPDFLVITERTGDPRKGFNYYDRPSKAYLFKDRNGDAVIFEGDDTYYETKNKIYVSSDNGTTWSNNTLPVYSILKENFFIQNKYNDIFYIYDSGLYKFNSDSNRLDKVANFPVKTFATDTTIDGNAYNFLMMDCDNKGAIIGLLKYSGLFYYPPEGTENIFPQPNPSMPILIFPNPVADEAIVQFHVDHDKSIVTIKVYDYLGREAQNSYLDFLKEGDYQQKINLGSLPRGLYFIVVNTSGTIRATAVHVKH